MTKMRNFDFENGSTVTQFLKAFENNADISTFIFQDAVTQEELIILIHFWCNNDINNI
jgi:hypothetical protein